MRIRYVKEKLWRPAHTLFCAGGYTTIWIDGISALSAVNFGMTVTTECGKVPPVQRDCWIIDV